MNSEKLKIVFFGTPEFAVGTLNQLIKNNCNVIAVVTAPDKPAGRGLKIRKSDVKEYAEANRITILQPEKLKNPEFVEGLKTFNADLFIVVAFRMLPEVIWKMPSKGTFNLHASLLPNYRGAAPINWAIINGENKSGVTTFFINEDIDTGNIIGQKEVIIEEYDSASTLHDKLKETGSLLVVKTVKDIANNRIQLINQNTLINSETELKKAPKIFKEDRKINWNQSALNIYNRIRGLSLFPCAFFNLNINGKTKEVKVYAAEFELNKNASKCEINTDGKSFYKIGCQDGYIAIKMLQMEGKKRMAIEEFLRGFNLNQTVTIEQ